MKYLHLFLILGLLCPTFAQDAVNPCAVDTETIDCSGPDGYPAEVDLRAIKLNGKRKDSPTVPAGADILVTAKLKYTKRGKGVITTTFTGSGTASCPDRIETKRIKPDVDVTYNATLSITGGATTNYTGTGLEFSVPAAALAGSSGTLNVMFSVTGSSSGCVATPYDVESKLFTLIIDDGTFYGNITAEVDGDKDDTDYTNSKRRSTTVNDGDYFMINRGMKVKYRVDFTTAAGASADDDDITWTCNPEDAGHFPSGNRGDAVTWEQKDGWRGTYKVRAEHKDGAFQEWDHTMVEINQPSITVAPSGTSSLTIPAADILPNGSDLNKIVALLSPPTDVGSKEDGVRLRTRTFTSASTDIASETFVPGETAQWLGNSLVVDSATYSVMGTDLVLTVVAGTTQGDYKLSWEIKRLLHSSRRFIHTAHVKVANPATLPTLTLAEDVTGDIGPLEISEGDSITFEATSTPAFPSGAPVWNVDTAMVPPNPGDITPTLSFDNVGIHTVSILDQGATASVEVHVMGLDVDADSDNNNNHASPDRSLAEDNVEATSPGKIIPVGLVDTDEDGIPDFADGYNQNATADDDESDGTCFAPVVIELPSPIDINVSKLRFTYSASDPMGVTTPGGVYTPAAGSLRLWTKPGDEERNGAQVSTSGDYVADAVYDATDLGFVGGANPERTVTLHMEAVRASTAMGDLSLVVDLDFDGDGTYDKTETLLFTALSVDLSAINPYLAEDKTTAFTGVPNLAGGTWQWAITHGKSRAKITAGDTTATVDLEGKKDSNHVGNVTLSVSYSLGGGTVTNKVLISVVESYFSRDPAQNYGWDSFTGGPYKSVAEGQSDTVTVNWNPSPLPDNMFLKSADVSKVTAQASVPGASSQIATINGIADDAANTHAITAHPGSATGPESGKLQTVVLKDKVRTVAVVHMTEDNDDVQVVPVGTAGTPTTVCVSKGPNNFRDTTPSGDDVVSGHDILMGPNGICDTTALNTDVPNNTVINATDLQNFLNDVYKQACIQWNVTLLAPKELSWDLDRDGELDRVQNALSSEELEIINNAVSGTYDHEVYLVSPFQQPSPNTGGTALGYAPRPGTFVFVSNDVHSGSTGSVYHTISHELGHNLSLRHTDGTVVNRPGDTYNLMLQHSTPANHTSLRQYQWIDINP